MLDIKKHSAHAKRLAEILHILCRYDLADWFKGVSIEFILDHLVSPKEKEILAMPLSKRLRLALTEMGTTFIKFGQILSTRADLVGPEVADELRKLQSDTPADEPALVKSMIEDELGDDPDVLFSKFECNALASASIGQVHTAQLADGKKVVVKVQHTGIQEKVHLDLELLQDLADLIQKHVPDARAYQPVATAREFKRTLLKELDFSCERRNIEQFTRNFRGDESVHIPITYPTLCSRRVLTMERLEGISGSKPDQLATAGVDLSEFANNAATVFLNMILRDGFYHADPHPGNFMLLDRGVLGLLDCGMVGHIDELLREQFEEMLLLLLQGDSEGVSDVLLRLGSAPPTINRADFQADISDLLVDMKTQPLQDIELGPVLEQITDILRRYQILMNSRMSLLLKTLVMLEGTSQLLSPTFSLGEILEPFKKKLIRERMDPRHWLRQSQRSVRDIYRLVRQAPRNVADILDRITTGELTVRHDIQHFEVIASRLVAGVLAASMFMGSSLLLSRGFPPEVSGISVFGAIGCLSSLILGGRLLWTIRKDLK